MTRKPVDLRQHPAHSVEEWLAARTIGRGRTSLAAAYQDYKDYCLAQGYQPIPKRVLSAAIKPTAPTFRSYGKRTFIPLCFA